MKTDHSKPRNGQTTEESFNCQHDKRQQARKIYRAKIAVICPTCEKIFLVIRYREQHKPVSRRELLVTCPACYKEPSQCN